MSRCVDDMNGEGQTAFCLAVTLGQVEHAGLLIDRGANVSYLDNGVAGPSGLIRDDTDAGNRVVARREADSESDSEWEDADDTGVIASEIDSHQRPRPIPASRTLRNLHLKQTWEVEIRVSRGKRGSRRRTRVRRDGGRSFTNRRRNHGRGVGPPNRAVRRRSQYERCQELYHKEPKRLGEMVASNDFFPIQVDNPPDKAQTDSLYTQLWGRTGPECPNDFYKTRA
ncbi:hypothetical protein QAD02_018351 [Eretmocerus hayati]|uniref:Uncharacterized protein n=1 Tax=Eretmocerus hayati TaxID=131215 RepID=A0ACC2PGY3_9HYME|nr:hypothetical protein QAD02_018351 [Eretmocerus hayati]